jgi:hypothetical protein
MEANFGFSRVGDNRVIAADGRRAATFELLCLKRTLFSRSDGATAENCG